VKKLWNVLTIMTIVSMLLAACSEQKTEQRIKPTKEDQPASEQTDKKLNLTSVQSDNQAFKISLLSDYTLEAEEPGKDVVLNKKDGNQSMRIELLPGDIHVNEMEANAKERANAVASDAKLFDGSLPFKEAVAYEAHVDDSIVYVILVKKDVPMFLTVFTKKENNLFEEFMTMAKTITPLAADPDTSGSNEEEKANDETFLYKSASQPFQARIMNGYKAEAIEPGKDMIFQDENKASMTIEILDDEADWALVSEQAESYAKESSQDGNVETMTWQEGNKLKGADVYRTKTEDGAVYVFVVKTMPMRLTIFTTNEQTDLSPFLTMAETIERID
jgi:hypothetical protein